jgi:hypothetical protein
MEVTCLRVELNEAREQQSAAAEVLRFAISASPDDCALRDHLRETSAQITSVVRIDWLMSVHSGLIFQIGLNRMQQSEDLGKIEANPLWQEFS